MQFCQILALSLTNTSFGVAYTYMQSAFLSLHEAESVRFDLGLEHESEEAYWDRVGEVIVNVGLAAKRPLDTLLRLGQAGHPGFVKTMQEPLLRLYPGRGPREKVWGWVLA